MKVKTQLTVSLTSMAHHEVLEVQAVGNMERRALDISSAQGAGEAWILPCIDLSDGRRTDVICGAVMVSALNRAGALTGRYFRFTALDDLPGKNYRAVQVDELQPDTE